MNSLAKEYAFSEIPVPSSWYKFVLSSSVLIIKTNGPRDTSAQTVIRCKGSIPCATSRHYNPPKPRLRVSKPPTPSRTITFINADRDQTAKSSICTSWSAGIATLQARLCHFQVNAAMPTRNMLIFSRSSCGVWPNSFL